MRRFLLITCYQARRLFHLYWVMLPLHTWLRDPHMAIDGYDDAGRVVFIGCSCGRFWFPESESNATV